MLDAASPFFADRAFLGVSRIGGPHQLPQVGDGVFLFQRQNDDRTAGHEFGQRVIERPARMYGIELLSLVFVNFQHLSGKNAEVIFRSEERRVGKEYYSM